MASMGQSLGDVDSRTMTTIMISIQFGNKAIRVGLLTVGCAGYLLFAFQAFFHSSLVQEES